MVDTNQALESKFVNADLVRDSASKILTIKGEGDYEEVEYDKEINLKLTLPVEIDGKEKIWRPNKDSVANMQVFGVDSGAWVGKRAKLQVVKMYGKETVLATAHPDDVIKAKQVKEEQKVAEETIQ